MLMGWETADSLSDKYPQMKELLTNTHFRYIRKPIDLKNVRKNILELGM